jgi:DNA invertase Pin-like site-specific DNA recombinase
MKKPKRIAIYSRVSTNGQSHASQLRGVRDYVRRRWPNGQVQKHSDQISGAKFAREGLDAMMAQVRQGRVDVIVVDKIDRLGRSLQHLAQLFGEFETHQTALVAASQGIDTSASNSAGVFQRNILAAVAEFERSIMAERIRAGHAVAREHGTKSGRPFGRPRFLDRYMAPAAKLSRKGWSGRQIAAKLGVPDGSIFYILKLAKGQRTSRLRRRNKVST